MGSEQCLLQHWISSNVHLRAALYKQQDEVIGSGWIFAGLRRISPRNPLRGSHESRGVSRLFTHRVLKLSRRPRFNQAPRLHSAALGLTHQMFANTADFAISLQAIRLQFSVLHAVHVYQMPLFEAIRAR